MISPRNTTNALLALIALLLTGVILKLTQAVLVPFVLACFLTAALYPLIRWMNRYIPSWLSLLLLLGLFGFLILSDALIFLFNLEEITQKAPQYNQRIQKLFHDLTKFGEQYGIQAPWKKISPEQAIRWLLSILGTWISSLFLILGQALLVVFFMIFLLVESQQFERKIRVAFTTDESQALLASVYSINEKIQRYMVTKTFISLLTGLMTSLATYLLGVDFPVLWGIIAFLLNYIPNIGSIVAVIPPVLIALLQKEQGYALALATLAILTTIQMVIGNLLDPHLTGDSLDISPLVVFLSLVFWGWLWGVIGMILAVPLTVVIKVFCEHTPTLRPFAILIGGEPRTTLPPSSTPSEKPPSSTPSEKPAPSAPSENPNVPLPTKTSSPARPPAQVAAQIHPSQAPKPPKKKKKR